MTFFDWLNISAVYPDLMGAALIKVNNNLLIFILVQHENFQKEIYCKIGSCNSRIISRYGNTFKGMGQTPDQYPVPQVDFGSFHN